jgi:hypothetical protein
MKFKTKQNTVVAPAKFKSTYKYIDVSKQKAWI